MGKDVNEETIAKRLYRIRLRRGLSISEVARHVGVSASTYRDWEYGRRITGEPYAKLAEILGISLVYLMLGRMSDAQAIRRDLEEIEGIIRRMKNGL